MICSLKNKKFIKVQRSKEEEGRKTILKHWRRIARTFDFVFQYRMSKVTLEILEVQDGTMNC